VIFFIYLHFLCTSEQQEKKKIHVMTPLNMTNKIFVNLC